MTPPDPREELTTGDRVYGWIGGVVFLVVLIAGLVFFINWAAHVPNNPIHTEQTTRKAP